MEQEVTRADIDRLHARMDQVAEGQLAQAVALARIEERVAQIKPVVLPSRPCEHMTRHQEAHAKADAESAKSWRELAVKLAVPTLAGAGAGGGVVAVVLRLLQAG